MRTLGMKQATACR